MEEEFVKNKRVAFGILANQFSRAFVSLNDASKPQRINNARELFCRASKRATWRCCCSKLIFYGGNFVSNSLKWVLVMIVGERFKLELRNGIWIGNEFGFRFCFWFWFRFWRLKCNNSNVCCCTFGPNNASCQCATTTKSTSIL